MKIKKQLVLTIMLLLATMPSTVNAQSGSNVIDEVVWVVGDEAIFKSDVEQARIDAQRNRQPIGGDPYCVLPEQLAIQKLFMHQAELDSVEVSDAEVYNYVERVMNSMLQSYGSIEKMEQYEQKTEAQIRDQLFESWKTQLMTRKVQSSLTENIKVTPAQVRSYFKDKPQDSIPFIPTKVEVQIFVRAPKISQEEIDRVKNDLRDYTERINAGQDKFSTLAVMYSEDPGSANQGGRIGFSGRGSLDPAYAAAAFNLNDTKTVSKIVESEFGFHIIQLIEKRGDQVDTRHILRKAKPTDAAIEEAINFVDSVCNEVRKGEYEFEAPLPYLSDDKESRNNYGILPNTYPQNQESENFGTSRFEMKELPTEIARQVANMQIGEISKPFLMIDRRGKEVVAAVRLKNRIDGHYATMTDDYQTLLGVVTADKQNQLIQQWIRDKQKSTYIRISDGWKNCEFSNPGWIKE